jgi:hypothetical protein
VVRPAAPHVAALGQQAAEERGQLALGSRVAAAGEGVDLGEPQRATYDVGLRAQDPAQQYVPPLFEVAVAEQVPAVPQVLVVGVRGWADRGEAVAPGARLGVHVPRQEIHRSTAVEGVLEGLLGCVVVLPVHRDKEPNSVMYVPVSARFVSGEETAPERRFT